MNNNMEATDLSEAEFVFADASLMDLFPDPTMMVSDT